VNDFASNTPDFHVSTPKANNPNNDWSPHSLSAMSSTVPRLMFGAQAADSSIYTPTLDSRVCDDPTVKCTNLPEYNKLVFRASSYVILGIEESSQSRGLLKELLEALSSVKRGGFFLHVSAEVRVNQVDLYEDVRTVTTIVEVHDTYIGEFDVISRPTGVYREIRVGQSWVRKATGAELDKHVNNPLTRYPTVVNWSRILGVPIQESRIHRYHWVWSD
jgi:hypothetical protein